MSSHPAKGEIRRALGRLVSSGPDAVWLPEVQVLLELPAVKERIEGAAGVSDALIAVLREAAEGLGQSQYRNLLEIVLGLNPETASMSAGERRHLAGIKFRGGDKPVTAGTIRQHHEPRALDQLAELLIEQADSARNRGSVPAEWPEWHPLIHAKWGDERLYLWRLALTDYHVPETLERLRALMSEHQVRTWAVHEMLGVFDLLVEAWLPADISTAAFEVGLGQILPELSLLDSFAVDEVVSHWAWQRQAQEKLQPLGSVLLAKRPPQRELEAVEQGKKELVKRYRETRLLEPVSEGPGIRFVLLITAQGGAPPLPMDARDAALRALRGLLEGGLGKMVRQEVLLRGAGFAHFVFRGCVAPEAFPLLSERLMRPLQEDLRGIWMRPQLFVLAGNEALERKASLFTGRPEEQQPGIEDLLQQPESARFQVRLAATADPQPDGELRVAGPSSRAIKALAKSVTGMLNGEGGTVVVGALPKSRAMRDPRMTMHIDRAPVIGRYVITGVGSEMKVDGDALLQLVLRSCSQMIEPQPSSLLAAAFQEVAGRTVLVITVRASDTAWFYFCPSSTEPPEFVVQTPVGLETFAGAKADEYKRMNPRVGKVSSQRSHRQYPGDD